MVKALSSAMKQWLAETYESGFRGSQTWISTLAMAIVTLDDKIKADIISHHKPMDANATTIKALGNCDDRIASLTSLYDEYRTSSKAFEIKGRAIDCRIVRLSKLIDASSPMVPNDEPEGVAAHDINDGASTSGEPSGAHFSDMNAAIGAGNVAAAGDDGDAGDAASASATTSATPTDVQESSALTSEIREMRLQAT